MSDMKNGDRPANPTIVRDNNLGPYNPEYAGLTKRETIAMHVLAGAWAQETSYKDAAKLAVRLADALLNALGGG